MLEQLGEKHEALPLAQALRQHVGRQHFLEDGHRREVLMAGSTVWPRPDEHRLKGAPSLATRRREENSAGQSNPRSSSARQSKTPPATGLIRAAAAAAGSCRIPQAEWPVLENLRGDQEMTTSFARKALLGTAIAASMGIGYAIGAQPHMTASVGLLQSARAELAAATPNKGGHREKALQLIDQAIGEVRAGIAFAGG
jgi:hypothetical protein